MIKAYYVIRKNLNMSPAKLAVQVGHGTAMLAYLDTAAFKLWYENHEMRKIVTEVSSLEKLCNLQKKLNEEDNITGPYLIGDNGYTEFDGPTITGLVFLIEGDTPSYIKRLRLYK